MSVEDVDPNAVAQNVSSLLKEHSLAGYKFTGLQLEKQEATAGFGAMSAESKCLREVSPGVWKFVDC